jgi:hypothetical protein
MLGTGLLFMESLREAHYDEWPAREKVRMQHARASSS